MRLQMFVALAEEKSLGKAAKRVFRTPPAVSMALRKLETEAGVLLFDASERSAYVLTPAGASLFSYAKRILALRDEALAELKSLSTSRLARSEWEPAARPGKGRDRNTTTLGGGK